MTKTMNDILGLDEAKCREIVDIKEKYIKGELTFEEAREIILQRFDSVTPHEFAFGEQMLKDDGIDDETMHEKMDDIIRLFDGVMEREHLELPEGHPIRSFMEENQIILGTIAEMKELLAGKFIKNRWLEVYDRLKEYIKHITRKHNQLFPYLEQKGFDRPTLIMWTFDDHVKKAILRSARYLDMDKEEAFLKIQPEVIEKIEDIIFKETQVLYPTSMELLSEEEFREMRIGEEEVGFANMEAPKGFLPPEKTERSSGGEPSFMKDFSALLSKYHMGAGTDTEMDVAIGKLTLAQINLIYRHLPIDLTFVDENDIVKFYTDTPVRVFSRSAGVIGRKVQNCHPREILPVVNRILGSFKSGEKDTAEFFINKPGKQIFVNYIAVRDENGVYRGCLETMQDVEHIRSLGNKPQSAPVWTGSKAGGSAEVEAETAEKEGDEGNTLEITGDTTLHRALQLYPYLKEFLLQLSPKYKPLSNPALFTMMSRVADFRTIAAKGGFTEEELLGKIKEEIKKRNNG